MIDRKISIIGLGYVGLPLAVSFSEKCKERVIAFDIKLARIEELKQGEDSTLEVDSERLQKANLLYTCNIEDLRKADFHIVSVPTPIDDSLQPDLSPLVSASRTVGSVVKFGDIVVFESTVYPGATEEICLPILERESSLKAGKDFFLAYSPERINPGDKVHCLENIVKVVSAQTPEALKIVSSVYSSIINAGVHEASSIRVAEAAKVIENTQRDINIAFVNELKIIFDKMNIDTNEVLEVAGTKWNFLNFKPGLVGGHCIGVDPYYLTYKAQQVGHHPEIILSGRRINDGMGKYFAERTIKSMIAKNIKVNGSKIGVLGVTFKENCPDIRNSKVIDIINELQDYHVNLVVVDPIANTEEVRVEYGIDLGSIEELLDVDAIIVAVAHDDFRDEKYSKLLKKAAVCMDIKGILSQA